MTANETTSTTMYRHSRTIAGLRECTDDASRIAVWAFPFSSISEIAADKSYRHLGQRLASPAKYSLTDGASVYIGESGNASRRLLDHANDPSKSFAREVFVVSCFDERRFDKAGALYFQSLFQTLAVRAGLLHVMGAPPPACRLPDAKKAPLDAMFDTARRLIFDAGCRAFDSANPGHLHPARTDGEAGGGEEDGADVGYFEIGVTTVPEGSSEFELTYGTVWARGHTVGDRFVIDAGSDVRASVNSSANPIYRERHKLLQARGVLQAIPGIEDRLRLTEAIAVGSPAIGAKMCCGAHVNAGKWRPLRPGRPLAAVA